MTIYAISDLHLSFNTNKPMNIFGDHWENYEQRILDDWNSKLDEHDIGVIAGDISWAMKMSETNLDFEYLKKLNGQKVIIRGNHDYWWKSITKIREELGPNIHVLQNDAIRLEFPSRGVPHSDGVCDDGGIVLAGTRGWKVPERKQPQKPDDKKIYEREILRFELALKDAKTKMHDEDKLVAVIHYPPFNATHDDSPFTKLCDKFEVDACIYGHLHGNPGRVALEVTKNKTKYYLTSCDIVGHKVVEINL